MSRVPGHRRLEPAVSSRQRPIQATLAALLVIPLLSLIALWAYAAASTIGSAVAKYNSDAIDQDVGTVTQNVLLQVAAERSDTLFFRTGVAGSPAPPSPPSARGPTRR